MCLPPPAPNPLTFFIPSTNTDKSFEVDVKILRELRRFAINHSAGEEELVQIISI